MNFSLGTNLGFAVNRYSEPEEWARFIGEKLGLKQVQLTADLLSPTLPAPIVRKQIERTLKACQTYQIKIGSTFTGAYTRLNHLAHPDKEIQAFWVDWFKKFVDISVDLGAKSMGSHFGIFTFKDNGTKESREHRRQENIKNWHSISEHAKQRGLEFLTWEPMSISREQGETLAETRRLQEDVNQGAALPFYLCLDVDHGDISSTNPKDYDPYAWLESFAAEAPLIHLKQSRKNKGGHWPFTAQNNRDGLIEPERVVEILKRKQNFSETHLLLELSFREREPADSSIEMAMQESVSFWRPFVDQE